MYDHRSHTKNMGVIGLWREKDQLFIPREMIGPPLCFKSEIVIHDTLS